MEIFSTLIPLILIIVISSLIVRIATVILKMTGLDEGTARFQAISAFTGTGFTTKEAENVTDDSMRRKTIIVLMVMGRVGVVSVIAGLFVSFGKGALLNDIWRALILFVILWLFYKVTTLKGFSRTLNKFIEKKIVARGLVKQKTLEELFSLPRGYGIAQLVITDDSEEKGMTLAQAGFINKNILVLSIERGDKLIAFPRADDKIVLADKLLCYGLIENIKLYA